MVVSVELVLNQFVGFFDATFTRHRVARKTTRRATGGPGLRCQHAEERRRNQRQTGQTPHLDLQFAKPCSPLGRATVTVLDSFVHVPVSQAGASLRSRTLAGKYRYPGYGRKTPSLATKFPLHKRRAGPQAVDCGRSTTLPRQHAEERRRNQRQKGADSAPCPLLWEDVLAVLKSHRVPVGFTRLPRPAKTTSRDRAAADAPWPSSQHASEQRQTCSQSERNEHL
jgi:hypothetical protein